MSSAHVTSMLTDHIDGTLSAYWTEKVKSHLIFCNSCRQQLSELEANVKTLRSTPIPPPPAGLEGRVIARLEGELRTIDFSSPASRASERRAWFPSFRQLAFAAACAVVGLALFSLPPSLRRAPSEKKAAGEQAVETQPLSDVAPGRITVAPAPQAMARRAAVQDPVANEFKSVEAARLKAYNQASRPSAAGAPVAEAPARDSRAEDEKLIAQPLAEVVPGPPALQELSGGSSSISTPMESVISNEAAWSRLWDAHTKNVSPKPERPKVDFKTNQVIAIFAGTKPSGGYGVRIDSVENTVWDGRPARVVRYSVKSPPEGAVTSSALSQPFVFKVVPRFPGRTFIQQGL